MINGRNLLCNCVGPTTADENNGKNTSTSIDDSECNTVVSHDIMTPRCDKGI